MEFKFDREKLAELMNDFYTLTNIRMVIFDNSLQKIFAYPENDCEFCGKMKENVRSRELCRACDTDACRRCRDENRMLIYKCHAGLTEAAFQLKYGDVSLGCIMFGQILDSDTSDEKRGELTAYAGQFISGAAELTEKLNRKTMEQIRAAAKVMETCACYLWVREMVKADSSGIAFRLSGYIEKNLSQSLSVEALCDRFEVSRNCLYRISHEFFDMSIAVYIRRKRVELAHKLLADGATVAEAAASVGIDDYNYFSKIYKRETGRLPSKDKVKI